MDWLASIKPANSNIPEYKDENYVFEEVQFMLCTLNENTLSINSDKCISLFQKYIPYQIVLIVEDNSDVRNYIREQLEIDYKVIEAGNGEEGIINAQIEIPDLIITDVMNAMSTTSGESQMDYQRAKKGIEHQGRKYNDKVITKRERSEKSGGRKRD